MEFFTQTLMDVLFDFFPHSLSVFLVYCLFKVPVISSVLKQCCKGSRVHVLIPFVNSWCENFYCPLSSKYACHSLSTLSFSFSDYQADWGKSTLVNETVRWWSMAFLPSAHQQTIQILTMQVWILRKRLPWLLRRDWKDLTVTQFV